VSRRLFKQRENDRIHYISVSRILSIIVHIFGKTQSISYVQTQNETTVLFHQLLTKGCKITSYIMGQRD
jgi:hypothetical protein